MPIPASEIVLIQADMAAVVCDKTCVISRSSTAQDAYGSLTESYSTVATTVCGMAQPSAGLLAAYNSKIGTQATYLVRFPSGTNVRQGDHLAIDGHTLQVHVLLNPQSYSTLDSVLAGEVK